MSLLIQIISMEENYLKKILILLLVGLILFIFFFFGTNFFKKQLASLATVIKALITLNPLNVDIFSPRQVKLERVFTVRAEIENKGDTKVEKVEAEIFLSQEIELVRRNKKQQIGELEANKKKNVFWQVKGKEIGNYIISVKATGLLKEVLISAEDSELVEIEKTSKGFWFQNFFNFFRKNFGD